MKEMLKKEGKEELENGLPLLDLCVLGIIEAPLWFGHKNKKAQRYEGSQSESESLRF